jgi:uncharacterized protein (DUF302 family)
LAAGLLIHRRGKVELIFRSPALRFTIDHPHAAAVRLVRCAFVEAGLRTPAELDVAERLREQLCANLVPSLVLFVDDPVLLLEAVMFYPGAALYIPQPIVITGRGRNTEVQIGCRESLIGSGLPPGVREPVLCLHGRVMRALDTVAFLEDRQMSACAHYAG